VEGSAAMLQEISESVANHVPEASIHSLIEELVYRLQEATEVLSAVLIGIGIAMASYQLVRLFATSRQKSKREIRLDYQEARLKLSRYLAMALEFQLAADLLGTTVSPSWDQLGRLGVIAVIRTFLNFFLAREIEEEENMTREAKVIAPAEQKVN
jgi:uncharacterized membrane protein